MNNIYNYDSYIFDMDGLLLDSELVAYQLFIEASKKYKYSISFNRYKECIGTSSSIRNQIISSIIGDNKDVDEFIEYWDTIYHKTVTNSPLPIKIHADKFLNELQNRKKTMIVATSTDTELAIKKLKNCGLFPYFKTIVGGDMVKHPKPSPEIYLKAIDFTGEEKCNIIAFEDSELGVTSAHNAGIDVVQIPDLIPASLKTRKYAIGICTSFKEVSHNKM